MAMVKITRNSTSPIFHLIAFTYEVNLGGAVVGCTTASSAAAAAAAGDA